MAIHRLNPAQAIGGFRATYSLHGIPEGIEGTRATLGIMRRLVREYKVNPMVLSTARSIVNGIVAKDHAGEAQALQQFVRSHVRYTQDVLDVETLQTPVATLKLRHGDCDDQATLLAALLNAVGIPARFVAVGFAPDVYEHVYVEAQIDGEWIPAETTEPVRFGEYPWGTGDVVTAMKLET